MENQKSMSLGDKIAVTTGFGYITAYGLTPLFRSGFGRRYFNVHALACVVIQFFLIGSLDTDPIWAELSTGLTCVMIAGHKFGNRHADHSYYSGTSMFGDRGKLLWEPLAGAAIAFCGFQVSQGLGVFYSLSTVGLVLTHGYSKAMTAVRIEHMRNEEIEARYLIEQYEDRYR
jgi:hypothetical protein